MFVGVQNIFNVLASYFHYFLLIPLLVEKKKYMTYVAFLALLIASMIWLRGLVESVVLNGLFNTDYYQKWTAGRIVSMVLSISSFILFTSFMKFTFDRFVLERQKKELENEKLNAELKYLKAQINPHFLFNTLHNLNYLTQAKKDKASEVVVRLSNIMRYMIYESNKSEVSLTDEIDYIKDYLNLEEIRLNHKFDISFDIEIEQEGVTIVPLILIPLVENAFKHGIRDQYPDSWIRMILSVSNNNLSLEVTNSLHPKEAQTNKEYGFGLKNLKKRLELAYIDNHHLKISKSEDTFYAHLDINLCRS